MLEEGGILHFCSDSYSCEDDNEEVEKKKQKRRGKRAGGRACCSLIDRRRDYVFGSLRCYSARRGKCRRRSGIAGFVHLGCEYGAGVAIALIISLIAVEAF